MQKIEEFTGRLCKKRTTLFGKHTLTFSNFRHIVKVECGKQLYEQLCEGLDLTITYSGKQLLSFRPDSSKPELLSTAIAETAHYQHGKILYYRSSRCMNTPDLQDFNQGLLTNDELVSFDCNLFEHLPLQPDEIEPQPPDYQVLAVIIEPIPTPDTSLAQDGRFAFCGYDLVEEQTQISAIIDCGGAYRNAIEYGQLNKFGLIDCYEEASRTQKNLRAVYPHEEHADCVIVEIWRYISE